MTLLGSRLVTLIQDGVDDQMPDAILQRSQNLTMNTEPLIKKPTSHHLSFQHKILCSSPQFKSLICLANRILRLAQPLSIPRRLTAEYSHGRCFFSQSTMVLCLRRPGPTSWFIESRMACRTTGWHPDCDKSNPPSSYPRYQRRIVADTRVILAWETRKSGFFTSR